MTTQLLIKSHFGIINGENINYSKEANAFLTPGYTSVAGNTYFNTLRFAKGIVIKEDVGQGWCHTFLNGMKIYSLKDHTLLADRNFHNYIYSKQAVKNEAVSMLLNTLREAAKKEGFQLDEPKALKEIEEIIDIALKTNQIEMLQKQTYKYLKK